MYAIRSYYALKYFLEKGFKGRIYPVNPKYEEIAGLRCFPDVTAIPGTVDLAVVALPAASVIVITSYSIHYTKLYEE